MFLVLVFRAANNGRSMDNVRPELDIDRTNPWIAEHVVRSFTDSFTEILIFNYLIITRDNIHVSERKKKTNINPLTPKPAATGCA